MSVGNSTQPFDFSDFSGGITDHYVGCAPNEYQAMDNFYIDADKKPRSRPGSELLDSTYPQLPTGNQRIGLVKNYGFDADILAQSAKRIFHLSNTGWSEILSPSGGSALLTGTVNNVISTTDWNGHTIITHDGHARPMKIFKDNTDTFRVVNAGLPKPLIDDGDDCTLVNADLANPFDEYSLLFQDELPSTTVSSQGGPYVYEYAVLYWYDTYKMGGYVTTNLANKSLPIGPGSTTEFLYRPYLSETYMKGLLRGVPNTALKVILFRTPALTGTGLYPPLPGTPLTESNYYKVAEWDNTEANKYTPLTDSMTDAVLITQPTLFSYTSYAFPGITTDDTRIVAHYIYEGTGDQYSYLYAFNYSYEYTVGELTFIDQGPVAYYPDSVTLRYPLGLAEQFGVPSYGVKIFNPPIGRASFDGFENVDFVTTKLNVYRTLATGNTFYLHSSHTLTADNPLVSEVILDTLSDEDLERKSTLYTTGGVVSNDPPPECKFVHTAGDVTLYGHYKEGSDTLGNQFRQSVPGDPDSVPATFFDRVEEELTGISSHNGTFIIATKRGIYRTSGLYDELGQGGILHQKIDDTATCISHTGMVQTTEGVFFPGEDGFYWTNAYEVRKISDGFNDTYKELVSTETKRKRITGVFDRKERLVHWTIEKDGSYGDVDSLITLHLRFGVQPRSCFTTSSGGESFAPTSLCFFEGDLIRADKRGYVFRHKDLLSTDPKINILTTPSTWSKQAIVWDYISGAWNFGSDFVRKWATRILVKAKNRANLSLSIVSINDDGRKEHELVPIRFRSNINWGDPDAVWGDPSIIWDYGGTIEEWRRFPAGSLRFSSKQIRLTNARLNVISSDAMAQAVVNNTLKTVFLLGGLEWNSDPIDYVISFENDNYSREFEIISRTSSTLTVEDSLNLLPNGTFKWVMKGIPKREMLHLLGFTMHVASHGKTQDGFQASERGGNS